MTVRPHALESYDNLAPREEKEEDGEQDASAAVAR